VAEYKIMIIQGHKVIVDKEDFSFLSRFTWHIRKSKYAWANVYAGSKQNAVPMHRLLFGLKKTLIDHKNRNALDNRKLNLRCCSQQENSLNRKSGKTNRHGFRGVIKSEKSKNFSFQITTRGKRYYESGFSTAKLAGKARETKCKELHGIFAMKGF
jgi:hypothetical protein